MAVGSITCGRFAVNCGKIAMRLQCFAVNLHHSVVSIHYICSALAGNFDRWVMHELLGNWAMSHRDQAMLELKLCIHCQKLYYPLKQTSNFSFFS